MNPTNKTKMSKKEKEEDIMPTDEEYLDKNFPKGNTHYRGQAMVVLALARQQGRQEAKQKEIKFLEEYLEYCICEMCNQKFIDKINKRLQEIK